MKLLEKNLATLSEKQPLLASQIQSSNATSDIKVGLSKKDGLPVVKIRNLSLHSWVDPVSEAKKVTEPLVLEKQQNLYVFGFGFGYHLAELLKRCNRLNVIEPSFEILKSAMVHVDLSEILPRITIITTTPPWKIASDIAREDTPLFIHPGSSRIFSKSYKDLIKACQAASTIPKLRILIVGPVYGGSLPTARYVHQSLVEMGHQTCFADTSIFSDSYHKIDQVTKKKGAEACIRSKYTDFLGEMVIAKAVDFAPDLIISIAQAPLSSRTLARLKQAEIPIAFWFVEDFRTLTYWREIGPHYDYFFSIQQGEFSTLLAKAGVKKAFYLPQACFPPTHTKLRLSQDELTLYGSDISFVGAGYYNRQKFFPGLTDFDFKIWGSDWSPSSALFPDVQMDGKRVEPAEYVKIFNASLINLNLHSSLFHEGVDPTGDFVNPRTFELASCGAFQLVDYRTELPELFEIDKEVACFRDLPDLKEKIGHYLAHPEERTAISKQARRRALKEHSFISRLHQLLTVIWLQEKESIEGKILEREAKKRSVNSVSRMLEEARGDEELSHFLAQFKEEDSISLSQIMDAISRGKGAITRPEAIFMMINEVLTEKNEEGTYS